MKSQFKFRRNIDIGSLDAENDQFLHTAFVDKNDLAILKDTQDRKCIILGRTGSGKSALITMLEKTEPALVRINPESISLRHLSNSDIINYFKKLDVKLDLFYKVLWKHVFIVELIKLRFNNDLNKSISILDWIKEKFPDKRKKQSIEYLEKWEDKFWEDTEYRVKELETSLENRFKKEIGGGVDIKALLRASGTGTSERNDSQSTKYEVLNKAQKVINESQVEHIQNILEMMKGELFSKSQRQYFIVIDDLDKEWVSDTIVYDLLRSLLETIKDLSSILVNVKIVIALRSNIHYKIFSENRSRGIQREKYNYLYLDLQWSKAQLKQLLDFRLRELMKGQYTSQSPTTDDILPETKKKQKSGLDYMLERSFYRPRDIIDYFNKCIKYADGKTKITREILKEAEEEYSNERLKAVSDEWLENFGNLSYLFGFLKNSRNGFHIPEIRECASEYFIEIISNNQIKDFASNLRGLFEKFGVDFDCEKLLKPILIVLYEVGIVGIKPAATFPITYVDNIKHFAVEDLNENTKFYIHPMFHRALRINIQEGSRDNF